MQYSRQLPFWLIAISLLIGLTLPVLIQNGMFMDAMLYTSVSHNLAKGIGTFWFPQFSYHNVFGLPAFHEQPPLVFGIQSLFFKVLGGSMYAERIYTFITLCITSWLIVLLWRKVYANYEELNRKVWWPLIIWITIPVCFWSYQNNMHENTMGIFTLTSVVFFYKSFELKRNAWSNALVAGVFVSFATLSKGVPGLFTLTAPFLFWVITRDISFRKALQVTAVATFTLLVIYGTLMLFEQSRLSLETYFIKRVLHRINDDPTVDSHFSILYRLLMELIAPIILTLTAWWITKQKAITTSQRNTRLAFFFIALGLAGSVPLMLTLVQKGFYFVPSLPMFGIGFAMLTVPLLSTFINRMSVQWNKSFTILGAVMMLTALTLTVVNIGKTSRDEEILHDVCIIDKTFPHYSIVGINNAAWNDWELQCYLMRYCNISISPDRLSNYFIIDKDLPATPPNGYTKLNLDTKRFDLYKR